MRSTPLPLEARVLRTAASGLARHAASAQPSAAHRLPTMPGDAHVASLVVVPTGRVETPWCASAEQSRFGYANGQAKRDGIRPELSEVWTS